ncbi:hypothetical protein KR200_006891, partial [Drosophila serrata]
FILQIIKIGLLLTLWSFFTTVIIISPVHEIDISVVTILPNETLVRGLVSLKGIARITLQGTITAVQKNLPGREDIVPAVSMHLEWLDSISNQTTQRTDMWHVYLNKDLKKFVRISQLFYKPDMRGNEVRGLLMLEGKGDIPLALIMETDSSPMLTKFGVIYCVLLLLGLYIIIFFELTDPTLGVILMATTALATLTALGERPSLPLITSWVDFRVIMFMLSMMIISGITSESGILDWLAIQIYRISKGQKWLILIFLALVTSLLSSLIPNVTLVFLMGPIAVMLCEAALVQTQFVLYVVLVYANIGGAFTLVSDPLNMIIATNTDVDWIDFTVHMFPGVVCALIVGLPVIYLTMRKKFSQLEDTQILVTEERRTTSKDLIRQVAQREALLRMREPLRSCIRPSSNYFKTLAYLEIHYGISDKKLLAKCMIVLILVEMVFVLHTHPLVPGASLHSVALMGALLLVILTKLDDMETVLRYLDWSVVLFLSAHFVFIAVVHELGLVPWLGDLVVKVISSVETRHQKTVAILLIIWLTAFLAAIVNNIAVTEMLLGLIQELTMHRKINVPLSPLIWALAYGASFGANGTLLGSHSNLIGVVVARRFGYHITFLQFFRYGFPVMLATLSVASAYLLIAHTL